VLMGDHYKDISFIFDVINQALFPPPLDRLLLQVTHFARASDLLELARQQTFDLIVLNRNGICWDSSQNMPELMAALRLKYGKPVLLLDSFQLEEGWSKERLEKAGVTYLRLPTTFREFLQALHRSSLVPRIWQ